VVCINRPVVQAFFGITVMANAFQIGIDTQLRAAGSDSIIVSMSGMLEVGFFCIFFIELILRLIGEGLSKFTQSGWNWLDFALVLISGFDLLFEYAVRSSAGMAEDMGQLRVMRLMKALRLIRVVRMLRILRFNLVIRVFKGLILLIMSLARTVQSLGWMLLLLFFFTYMVGIMMTEFVGMETEDSELEEWFGDLVKSMFTLFQMSTLEDWGHIARRVGAVFGAPFQLVLLMYVFSSNLILLNVVTAVLTYQIFELNSEVKEEMPAWIKTPRGENVEEYEDEQDDVGRNEGQNANGGAAAGGAATQQQSVADRITTQTLSEAFDLASVYVGTEGVDQRRVVTLKSLTETLIRADVHSKFIQACPAMVGMEAADMAKTIMQSCPKRIDPDGLSRVELAEAVLAMRGELSMNHFVSISQALAKLEKHVNTELVHLNKHQRKLNRRFLKLRHRLRKVYHFDGAPRKMVEMMNDLKRKALAKAADAAAKGDPGPLEVLQKRRDEYGDAGSSEVSLTDDSSLADSASDGDK